MTQNSDQNQKQNDLLRWGIELVGEWSIEEVERIHAVFRKLADLGGNSSLKNLFNSQKTTFYHSDRTGKVGRTKGGEIYLDNNWSNWTLAHELGHRWNNAWTRQPEENLRATLGAGKFEWLKRQLRRFEKWLTRVLQKWGSKTRIDWKALWYNPGSGAPPCGVDRNFNSSEDLAESFAATIFPEDAKQRASKASKRLADKFLNWDWGKRYEIFHLTPRGTTTLQMIRAHLSTDQSPDQPDHRAA
jgi:hypothetical protein